MTTANTNNDARNITLLAVNGDEISRTLWGFRNTHLETFQSYCTSQCWHLCDAESGHVIGEALVVVVNGYFGTESRIAFVFHDEHGFLTLDNCKMSFARGIDPALKSFGHNVVGLAD